MGTASGQTRTTKRTARQSLLPQGHGDRILDRLLLLEKVIPTSDVLQVLHDTGCLDARRCTLTFRTPDIPTKSWAFSPSWPEQCDESSERLLGVLTSTTHSCAAAVSLVATPAGGEKTAHASSNLCQEF